MFIRLAVAALVAGTPLSAPAQGSTGTIGDRAWIDTNANAMFDAGVDRPLEGVQVTLTRGGEVLGSTLTDADGVYGFTNVPAGGGYMLQFDATSVADAAGEGALTFLSAEGDLAVPDDNDADDADGDRIGMVGPFSVGAEETVFADAGLVDCGEEANADLPACAGLAAAPLGAAAGSIPVVVPIIAGAVAVGVTAAILVSDDSTSTTSTVPQGN